MLKKGAVTVANYNYAYKKLFSGTLRLYMVKYTKKEKRIPYDI